MRSKLEKEVAELRAEVRELRCQVARLASPEASAPSASELTPERLLALKRIAAADAAGNPGPRRMYNEERRKELEAERRLPGSRS